VIGPEESRRDIISDNHVDCIVMVAIDNANDSNE